MDNDLQAANNRIAELENTTVELFAAVTRLTIENRRMREQNCPESKQESETGVVVIGGSNDGKRVPLHYSNRQYLRLPAYPPSLSFSSPSCCLPPMTEIRDEEYLRVEFADRHGINYAWVHPSVRHPMRELLHGYRRANVAGD
jgi:hypothetical protein